MWNFYQGIRPGCNNIRDMNGVPLPSEPLVELVENRNDVGLDDIAKEAAADAARNTRVIHYMRCGLLFRTNRQFPWRTIV